MLTILERNQIKEIKQKSKLVFFELKLVPFNADANAAMRGGGCGGGIGAGEDASTAAATATATTTTTTPNVATKNQRDAFYDMLWQWERHHKQEGWSFGETYGERIRAMIGQHASAASLYQFVKLFQEQLVLMCKHDKLVIDVAAEANEEPNDTTNNQQTLTSDPMRLKRLNARMSMAQVSHYGPNPAPK